MMDAVRRQAVLAHQRKYWDEHGNPRGPDHPVVRFFASQRVAYIERRIDLSTVGSAVEVGAGNGFATAAMQAVVPRLAATDLSLSMLQANPLRSRALVQAAAESLPFASGSADLVFAWEVLHHVSDVAGAVREMARVTRRWVLLFEPNRNNPAQFLHSLLAPHERGGLKFTRNYLARICREAGLAVRSIETVGATLPNRMPEIFLPLLRRVPFVLPVVGISTAVVATKDGRAG
ncbi:MAG: methyltransferase domain-containing protein [Planctomycetes bacterium]|nr:methyltransferase domain-containing protein [Planctomycetota bacterium]